MTHYLWAFALLSVCSYASAAPMVASANEITEEWLINSGNATGYTDHVIHFTHLFNKLHVRTFLEFGLGFSTKYFMDNSEKVISVEFVAPGYGSEWLTECINLYRNCANWKPIAYLAGSGMVLSGAPDIYVGTESLYRACVAQQHHQNYALIDSSYLNDLCNFVDLQLANNEIDVAFVDPGVYIRGDIVRVLFDKVPIIVAHDIVPMDQRNLITDDYGYSRVVAPSNYIEIHIPKGCGTAFWIKNEPKYQDLIQDLQNYAKR